MDDWNFYWKIITVVLGTTGLWKVIELLFKVRLERRLREAETKNLQVQAEGQIVGNWIQWSQHLEQRVKELEHLEQRVKELESVAEDNRKLTETVESQRKMIDSQKGRIIKLEKKVEILSKEKSALEKEVIQLRNDAA